jgi:hypothetical protein
VSRFTSVWTVPPLDLPAAAMEDRARIAESAAVMLFVERAHANNRILF